MYRLAKQDHERGEFDSALQRYALISETFGDTDFADDALLGAARIYWRARRADEARVQIQRLISSTVHRDSPNGAGARVLLAEIELATAGTRSDLERARTRLENVPEIFGRSRYPDLDWRAEARVRHGELSILLGDEAQAARSFVAVLDEEPESPWAAAAQFGLADVVLRKGDWLSAIDLLQRILAEDDSQPGETRAVTQAARRRLTLIHRLYLRRGLGAGPWSRAARVSTVGERLRDPVGIAATENGTLLIVDEGAQLAFVLGLDPPAVVERWNNPTVRRIGFPWWEQERAYTLPVRVVNQVAYLPNEEASNVRPLNGRSTTFKADWENREQPLDELHAGERGLFGRWFLVDRERRRVLEFNEKGEYERDLIPRGSRRPVDIAKDRLGRLYVLDRETKTVERYAADRSRSDLVVMRQDGWRRAEALAVDPLFNVYVLDRDAKRVFVYDSSGDDLQSFGPELPGGTATLGGPRDLAVDGSGTIYVVDRDRDAIFAIR